MGWRLALVACLVVAVGIWRGWDAPLPESRRPLPDPPDFGEIRGALPEISTADPEVSVGLGPKSDSTGTAFAWNEAGWWMTARHVVDQCGRIHLRFPRRRGLNVTRVMQHPRADLALLFAAGAGAPLVLAGRPLSIGQDGYQVGYPAGRSGEVWSTLLGRRRMRVNGRYRTVEPVVAWSERRRRPAGLHSLGGLSGGPALDAGGRVAGVLLAESRRRGRLYTAAPVSIRQMSTASTRAATRGAVLTIKPDTLRARAHALRGAPSVAKVVCLVGSRLRRS